MKFTKEFLQDEQGITVYDKIIDHSRWAVGHERVFEHEGKFYRTTYRVGATEYQDEQPYEYDANEIECIEVVPIEQVVIIYVATPVNAKEE